MIRDGDRDVYDHPKLDPLFISCPLRHNAERRCIRLVSSYKSFKSGVRILVTEKHSSYVTRKRWGAPVCTFLPTILSSHVFICLSLFRILTSSWKKSKKGTPSKLIVASSGRRGI